ASCTLNHVNTFELLISTILSAQSTDKQINKITPKLFQKYPTAEKMANADIEKIKVLIKSSGFYNAKAKNIINASKKIVSNYSGEVPDNLKDLITLSGVGRKTANVVLATAHNKPAIAVDTHVARISKHLGLTEHTDPVKIEKDLQNELPKKYWSIWNHLIIEHGRAICKARNPQCSICEINKLCHKYLNDKMESL
ncbi:MAG: endonuclease III, partial [Candidatus Marinimicrobia bacterium]|nr:endonuclease III [Candidatus Neomarinimicrobiota bacterium]